MKPIPLVFCASLACIASGVALAEDPPPIPLPGAPVERVQKRLVQIDVLVEGPDNAARGLGPSDFQVTVGGREIGEFTVDDMCRTGPGQTPGSFSASPASFVFYFDQLQLSPAGRLRAFAVARDLVPRLIVGGNQALVVSSADRVRVMGSWTTDPAAVAAALDELEADPSQVDSSVALESILVERITRTISEAAGERARRPPDSANTRRAGSGGGGRVPSGNRLRSGPDPEGGISMRGLSENPLPFNAAVEEAKGVNAAASGAAGTAVFALARDNQHDEAQRAWKSAERLAAVIARLSETGPPKAILYFADAFRKNPGQHYFDLIGKAAEANRLGWNAREKPGTASPHDFDHVIAPLLHEAAAKGVKFFTVQAEGLVDTTGRVRDAQSTLSAMSLETGGAAFLNGIPAASIAARITGALSCAYLISFDKKGIAEDIPLRVDISVNRPGVSVRAPGTVVVESESRRGISQIIASALGATEVEGSPLRVGLVPLGWQDGRYSALVQVAAAASGPSQDWELGATLTSAGTVSTGKHRRVTAAGAVPIILEDVMEFAAGPYDLLGLGRETTTDRAVSSRATGAWPKLNDTLASVSPIAIVQPSAGIFVRGDVDKRRGMLVVPEAHPVSSGSAIGLVLLVCRSSDGPRTLRVRRDITGETTVPFPETPLELKSERCAQIRDVVPERTLAGGWFTYAVEVLDGETPLVRRVREFEIVEN